MSVQSARIVRVVALSGAAAAAVLGVAGTASAATPETVTAQSVEAATGTPVRWVDAGRTITVTGLPVSSYTASDAHHAAVADMAANTTPSGLGVGTPGVGTPGVGSPTGTVPATYTDQVSAGSGGTITVGATATLILLVVLVFAIRHGKVSVTWVVTSAVLGVLLAGTVFGAMASSMAGNGVTSLGSMLGNL
jgi:hypothetical protein